MDNKINFCFKTAMKKLNIKLVEYKPEKGGKEDPFNRRGYSTGREIAINKASPFSEKTMFHEMGHILLGHTTGNLFEMIKKKINIEHRAIHEVQAESVALICIGVCGYDGHDDGMKYLKGWATVIDGFEQVEMDKVGQIAKQIIEAGRVE